MSSTNTNSQDELIPIGTVARVFGVTAQTVRAWEAGGKITAIRTPGNQRRFRRGDVEALVSGDAA